MATDISGYYLGIEGGGTRSTLVLADARGEVVAELQGGPANLRLLSDRQLLWVLKGFATRLPKLGGPLLGIAVGLAGARTEADRQRIRQAVARVWPEVPCHAGDDLETALMTAPEAPNCKARVLILSGTGSCVYGLTPTGKTAKVGGRGHVIGDRGSACDIGKRALRAVVTDYDHRGRWPKLGEAILRTLLLNDPEDLIPWSMEADKTQLASLAVMVFERASKRDPLARSLLDEAAQALAEDGHACALKLCKAGERVQFVFNGGVLLRNASFANDVAKRLKQHWPDAVITRVDRASSWGAVELARQVGGAGLKTPPPLPEPGRSCLPEDHPAFDRNRLLASPTEQRNPRSVKLDKLALPEAVELMLSEEAGVTDALLREKSTIVWVIQKIIAAFHAERQLYYVGAGTSGRLGVLDASECPPTFRAPKEQVQGIIAGGQRALWSAVEGAEDDAVAGAQAIESRGIGKGDVVIGIAASGRTPFVWGALAEAAQRGATTALVCFNPAFKSLPRKPGLFYPHQIIAPNLGPEVLTGSTRLKAGTATKLLLNLFTTLAMVHSGKVISNLMVDLNPSNVKLRVRAVGILQQLTGCDEATAQATLEHHGWVVKAAWQALAKRPEGPK